MKPFLPYLPGAPADTVQQRAVEAFESLGELAGGRYLGQFAVGTTETRIPHGLGSAPFMPLAVPMADARVWAPRVPDATYLFLQASAAVTCLVVAV